MELKNFYRQNFLTFVKILLDFSPASLYNSIYVSGVRGMFLNQKKRKEEEEYEEMVNCSSRRGNGVFL